MREFYTTVAQVCQAENSECFTGDNFSLYPKNEHHVKEKNQRPFESLQNIPSSTEMLSTLC